MREEALAKEKVSSSLHPPKVNLFSRVEVWGNKRWVFLFLPRTKKVTPAVSPESEKRKKHQDLSILVDMAQFHKKAETPFVTKDEASYQLCFFCMESLGKWEKERSIR